MSESQWTEARDKWSKFKLMLEYHKAKEEYYVSGSSSLSDYEFDCLESSTIAIHGKEFFKRWSCVGYDVNIHKAVRIIFEWWDNINKRNAEKSNELARAINNEKLGKIEKIEENIIIKEEVKIDKFDTEEDSCQFVMF